MTEWIVTSSAMIMIVIAMRGLLKGKISLKLQYGLWALVLIRLLIPFSIADSAISIANILSTPTITETDNALADYKDSIDNIRNDYIQRGESVTTEELRLQALEALQNKTHAKLEQEYAQAGSQVQNPQVQEEIRQQAQQQVAVINITAMVTDALPYLWVAGMVLVGAVLIGSNVHFGWKLRKSRKELDLPDLPAKAYLTDYVATPCLFGIGKPDIYLTNEVMEDSRMRNHVLAHEMSHYRQGDHIWSVLRCLCLVLHWYNPLVWVAAILSKQDAELACDEATIKALGETERTAYGRTLIGMTCVRRDPRSLMLTATTMLGTKKTLKERILLIAKKPRMALYTLVACILVAAIAVGCTFTGASPKSEEQLLLDRCREAVEYIHALEAFEIQEKYSNNDPEALLDREFVDYFRSGNEFYHEYVTDDITQKNVYIDGTQYRKHITTAISFEDNPYNEWVEVSFENFYFPSIWIMDFGWENQGFQYTYFTGAGSGGYEGCNFTVLSVSGDETSITLELQPSEQEENSPAWTLYFLFDQSGKPVEITRAIHNGEYMSIRELSIVSTDPEEVNTVIHAAYSEATGETVDTPEYSALGWELPNHPQLSYGEYFSEVRYYYYAAAGERPKHQYYWGGWNNGKDKCEVWMRDGKIFAGDSLTGNYVQVGNETFENTKVTCCDEFWIYCIKDQTELFRIDYKGENRQTLYVDETKKIAPFDITYSHVRDNSVLFFVAAAGEKYGIYRLYLPDMTLDLLYITEDIPHLYEPYSNFEITWSTKVKEIINDVTEIDYYYNCLTGELLDRPVVGDRSWGNSTWAWWLENIDVQNFQDLLSYENGYWYWRALGCIYDSPDTLDLEYLFYNGLPDEREENQDPTGLNPYTDSEMTFLQAYAREKFGDESVWVNAHKLPREAVNDVLLEYFGANLNTVSIPEDWVYFEETDSYYTIHLDAYGIDDHEVVDVQYEENGFVWVYWVTTDWILDTRNDFDGWLIPLEGQANRMVMLLLERKDGTYDVLSNQPVEPEEPADPVPHITNIRDRSKEENLPVAEALERFFSDVDNNYYFPGIKSQYITVYYSDGTSENIITALQTERATIADLDTFGIKYITNPRE